MWQIGSSPPSSDSKKHAIHENRTMKVYQLVAVGRLKVTGESRAVHSKKVYRSKKVAEKAIPNFRAKLVTLPKGEFDLMVMTDNPLRVFVETLEVV
jgi:hypothetical protein